MLPHIYPFLIYKFIHPQISVEHLLCAKPCSRLFRYISEQNRQRSPPSENLHLKWGRQTINKIVSMKYHGKNIEAAIRGIRIVGVKGWERSCSIKVVNIGLTEKVTCEQKLERHEGVSSADMEEEHSRERV